jgi:hypothetical protein
VPEVTPYAVHGVLNLVALIIVLAAPESLPKHRRSQQHWWQGLRIPLVGHRTFVRLIIPAAPWVFGAAGIAYAVMPALVQDSWGSGRPCTRPCSPSSPSVPGRSCRTLVPRINRWTGGRGLVVGLAMMSLGMMLAVVAALVADPILAFVVAIVLGLAYGICVVSGLIIVQAIAEPDDLAGITGVYYSLAYSGFLLPTVLAALLPLMGYSLSLGGVAVICLLSLAAVARASNRRW